MRSDFLQFAFYLIALVLGGACEELLPKAAGVGFPVLMALSACVAARRPVPTMVPFALTAGAFEDALSSLPSLTGPCLFLSVAAVAHKTRFPKAVVAVAYSLFQLWLKFLVPCAAGSLGARFLLSLPIAVATAAAVDVLLAWTERKAAFDAA